MEVICWALQLSALTTDRGKQLAMYSHIVRVQVNASTLTRKDLEDLRKNGAQLDHIDSLHNFYPRPHTGLALDYFKTQTDRLHACGLSVGAFVASQAGQRAPLYEGLPTLDSTAIRTSAWQPAMASWRPVRLHRRRQAGR